MHAKEKNRFKIVVDGCKRDFKFKGETNKQTEDWFNLIQNHIQLSDGLKLTNTLSCGNEFWKFPEISEE